MNLEITHNEKDRVFRTFVNDKECVLKYREEGPTMIEIFETFVPLVERKEGIGTALVEEALRYAQLNNLMVIPNCNFVADYMDRHHEYAKMRVDPKK